MAKTGRPPKPEAHRVFHRPSRRRELASIPALWPERRGEPGLAAIAEIVHEIDLRDGRYTRPELAGVESVLAGWQDAGLPDEEMEAAGLQLFDGLFASLRRLEPPSAGSEQTSR